MKGLTYLQIPKKSLKPEVIWEVFMKGLTDLQSPKKSLKPEALWEVLFESLYRFVGSYRDGLRIANYTYTVGVDSHGEYISTPRLRLNASMFPGLSDMPAGYKYIEPLLVYYKAVKMPCKGYTYNGLVELLTIVGTPIGVNTIGLPMFGNTPSGACTVWFMLDTNKDTIIIRIDDTYMAPTPFLLELQLITLLGGSYSYLHSFYHNAEGLNGTDMCKLMYGYLHKFKKNNLDTADRKDGVPVGKYIVSMLNINNKNVLRICDAGSNFIGAVSCSCESFETVCDEYNKDRFRRAVAELLNEADA